MSEGTVILADEAHNLKSGKAKRTQAFRALSESVRNKNGRAWLLTATPLLNRPPELWTVLNAAGLAQEAFGSYKGFLKEFNARPKHFGGYDFGAPSEGVDERLRRVMLRRMRQEVLPELPTKTWQAVDVDVDVRSLKECDAALAEVGGVDSIVQALAKGEKLEFATLSKAREALSRAKIPAAVKLVEEYEEASEPVLVFSAFVAATEVIGAREGWETITGETSSEERTRIEDRFQRGELKGIAATIRAAGVAITLTRAAHAIFVDREWNPALNSQAEDRICRIGQDRGCLIKILRSSHPIDQRIDEVVLGKQRMIEGSVDAARTNEGSDVRETLAQNEEAVKLAGLEEKEDEPAPSRSRRRAWKTPMESWAADGLLTLASLDGDHAAKDNGVGFSKTDTDVGHSLAAQLPMLTERQWQLAVTIATRYRRQLGTPPEELIEKLSKTFPCIISPNTVRRSSPYEDEQEEREFDQEEREGPGRRGLRQDLRHPRRAHAGAARRRPRHRRQHLRRRRR